MTRIGKEHFIGLEWLRFLLGVYVVVFHTLHNYPSEEKPSWLVDLTGVGFFATSSFFVLSGFLLAHVYCRQGQLREPARSFWSRRFANLYPLHLFSLALTGVVLFIIMATWVRGSQILTAKTRRDSVPLADLMEILRARAPHRAPGHAAATGAVRQRPVGNALIGIAGDGIAGCDAAGRDRDSDAIGQIIGRRLRPTNPGFDMRDEVKLDARCRIPQLDPPPDGIGCPVWAIGRGKTASCQGQRGKAKQKVAAVRRRH